MSETVWRWVEGAALMLASGAVGVATWVVTRYYSDHETLNTHTRQIGELRTDVDGLNEDHDDVRETMSEMKNTLGTMATDITWIKQDLAARRNQG